MAGNSGDLENIIGMTGNKRLRVDTDTQIHMRTDFSRKGSKKEVTKRNFSLVIKGLMIGTAMVGSFLGMATQAFASTGNIGTAGGYSDITQSYSDTSEVKDEVAILLNLKMANKLLSASLDRGELSEGAYGSMQSRLTSLSSYLDSSSVKDEASLSGILSETDSLLNVELGSGVSDSLLSKRAESVKILNEIKDKINFEISKINKVIAGVDGGGVSAANIATLSVASTRVSAPTAKVIIDGQVTKFQGQGAVVMSGSTMVPMREIFEKLGATLSWNQTTKTVTAIKGDTKIVLTIGKQTATINGNKVTLTKEAVVLNGVTLVPLRFVSEALGAKVAWDQKASVATITSSTVQAVPPTVTPSAPVVDNGGTGVKVGNIFVKYGTHTYESKTQAEYDAVMKVVENGMNGYKTNSFIQQDKLSSDPEFMRGVADGLAQTVTYRGEEIDNYWSGVITVTNSLKSMRDNGVPTDKAVEAYTIFTIGSKATKANSAPSNDAQIRSAYHSLIEGKNDCDSWANAMIAHYDAAGYNTAIVANSTHADAYVKVGTGWYKVSGGLTYRGESLPSGSGTYVYAAPTF